MIESFGPADSGNQFSGSAIRHDDANRVFADDLGTFGDGAEVELRSRLLNRVLAVNHSIGRGDLEQLVEVPGEHVGISRCLILFFGGVCASPNRSSRCAAHIADDR